MGLLDGNCPSSKYQRTREIDFYNDLKNKIENLFQIKITSNKKITQEKIVTKLSDREITERFMKRIKRRRYFKSDRPSYDPISGIIIIPESRNNERTFVHEALHSFSNLTLEQLMDHDYDNDFSLIIRDGITEFLTGCILYVFFPNCYEFFKYPSFYSKNEIGYRIKYEPKFWFVFSQVFGIKIILDLYFNKKLEIESYNDIYNYLIEHIKVKYHNFEIENPQYFDSWEYSLLQVSEEFKIYYSQIDKELDFSIFPFL